jgi:hypothetical protein
MADLEQALPNSMEPDEEEAPLYHYTSATGFMGIIESGRIWASHFDHLNDPRELRYGEDVVLGEAKAIAAAWPKESLRRGFVEDFIMNYPRVRLTEVAGVYLASLSQARDQLSQWRAYGRDGSGFSFGFRSLPLPKPDNWPADVVLVKCEYRRESLRECAQRILVTVAEAFEGFSKTPVGAPGGDEAIYDQAWKSLFIQIGQEIPRFKNRFFAEEQEWRLVVIPMSGREKEIVKVRTSASGLRPYIEIDLAGPGRRLDLAEIVVGPGQRPAIAECCEHVSRRARVRSWPPTSVRWLLSRGSGLTNRCSRRSTGVVGAMILVAPG